MNNISKNITLVDIKEEIKYSYLNYAMSVIVGRALPDVRDGLKPVHRRILYAMYKLHNYWNKPHKKSARIVGDVIGKYHPHGDIAVYDTIIRMAQTFSMRYTLIDGQGNFGSIDGDCAAAMRYTEIRMSKIANEMIMDLEKETVDFLPNYDETEKIPDVMPTKIPNILINGSSGIAVGMATNIPPHNLTEVINGCLAYIKDNNISTKELIKYIKGPDFPTAGIININNNILEIYQKGKGKIYIQAKISIEVDTKNNREIIIINELPYQVNKSNLIKKIVELIKEKKITGINNLRDESDRNGIRIIIEIKRDAVGEIVLNNLYSLTQLRISFNINMIVIHKGQPKNLSLKDIISAFINHRQEVVTLRSIFELKNLKNRAHILESLLITMDNINIIIDLIRKSSNTIDAKFKLSSNAFKIGNISNIIKNNIKFTKIKSTSSKYGIYNDQYYFTELQVKAILDIKLQKLTNLEHKNLINEYKEIINKIIKLIEILENHNLLMKLISKELILIKKQYGDTRRTQIIYNTPNFNKDDLIHKENVVITLTNYGYIKYQPISCYETQHRGGKGKSIIDIKNKDFIKKIFIANTHDNILLFSNYGKVYWLKVYQLPEIGKNSRGKPIINLLSLQYNEYITAILPLQKYENENYLFMVTTNGIIKKIALNKFNRIRNNGIIIINLIEGDELVGVNLTNGKDNIMLFSSLGKMVNFSENEVRDMNRNTTGVKGINLTNNDKIVSLIVPKKNESILTVTQNGYGKITKQTEYPLKSRATKGIASIRVNKRNGKVIGAIPVKENDQILIITNLGTLVRTRVFEINTVGRNTQGVMLIRTVKNENVIGLQRIINNN